MSTVHINGRFLTQKLSGVQRYAIQLVTALDVLLSDNVVLKNQLGAIVLWHPAPAHPLCLPAWKNIEVRELKGFSGHVWEQLSLPRVVGKELLLSLCGSGPIVHRKQFLVIHDANIWALPQAFSLRYRWFHKLVRPILAKRVAALSTVSHFSAGELSRCLGVPRAKFHVIYNSAEHIKGTNPDHSVLERSGLSKGGYFLAVGNQSPNKNISVLLKARDQLGGDTPPLVLVGGCAAGVAEVNLHSSKRLVMLGRVTDQELALLYASALAFLWPSFYEGFGIPPLEAMCLGTPVIASNTSAMPEVLGEAVLYFNPYDVHSVSASLSQFLAYDNDQVSALGLSGQAQAAKYSWESSARELIDLILQFK